MSDNITDAVAFESAFHYSAVGMAFMALEGKFLRVNDSFSNILCYSKNDLLDMHFKNVTHPDDMESCLGYMKLLLSRDKETCQFEKRCIRSDGSFLWSLVSLSLVRKEDGDPDFFITQIQDISQRTIAEEKHQKSKELFELVVKGSKDAIWDWPNMDKDESYASPQLLEILGYKEGELDTRPSEYFKMIHHDDIDYVSKIMEMHLKSRLPFEMEYRIRTKSGAYKWIQSRGIASQIKESRHVRITGSLTDIDERKKTELLLKESQELFDLVVEGSRDGIWDCPDMDKDEGYWSPGFKKILGYEDDELEASTKLFLALIHPDDVDFVLKTIEEHLKTRLPFEVEYRVKTKSGKYKWIQARGIASPSKNPGSSRMTGSLSDISIRKESEEKLAEHAKELERINEDLNSFAYIASHDLKEPIRGIYSNIIFLEQDFEGQLLPEVARRLGRMSYLCERMEKLTDDLLNYAKLKNKDLVIKRIDLNEVIQDIVNTIDKGSNNHHIEIDIPSAMPKVICDEVTISELFRNLIHNGIKYNNNDIKTIEIGYNEIVDSDNIPKHAFYVKDNGIGIKKEDLDQIFHIFKRLDNTEELVKGSGMGLSFVQRIIERHGGKIWVDSDFGKGSIFYFTLN